MSQKSELPIIDAEFVDIPTEKAPRMALEPRKASRGRQTTPKKLKRATSPTEGRIDKLASGALKVAYAKQTGIPPSNQISGAIDAAVGMILGPTKAAKGPEWDFLKALLG